MLMKKYLTVLLVTIILSCSSEAFSQTQNRNKNPESRKAGWEVLFDGSNTDKWRGKLESDFRRKAGRLKTACCFWTARVGETL